jgi:hypothetical protein
MYTNGEKRNAYRRLVGKIPLGRPRRRWLDNVKMDLRGIGWGGTDGMDLAQDRDQWRDYDEARQCCWRPSVKIKTSRRPCW